MLRITLHKAKKILEDEIKFDHRTKRWKKKNYYLKKRCESILSHKVGYYEPRVHWSIDVISHYKNESELKYGSVVKVTLRYYNAKEGTKDLVFEIDPRSFRRKDKLRKLLG